MSERWQLKPRGYKHGKTLFMLDRAAQEAKSGEVVTIVCPPEQVEGIKRQLSEKLTPEEMERVRFSR